MLNPDLSNRKNEGILRSGQMHVPRVSGRGGFIPPCPPISAAHQGCGHGSGQAAAELPGRSPPQRDPPLQPGRQGGREREKGGAKEGVKGTHKSVLVRDVVSELQLVKGDDFGHPLFAGGRAVRVDVHSLWHFRVSFAGYHPPGIMEFVPTIISRHNIHQ